MAGKFSSVKQHNARTQQETGTDSLCFYHYLLVLTSFDYDHELDQSCSFNEYFSETLTRILEPPRQYGGKLIQNKKKYIQETESLQKDVLLFLLRTKALTKFYLNALHHKDEKLRNKTKNFISTITFTAFTSINAK